jgi:hypothetical protein
MALPGIDLLICILDSDRLLLHVIILGDDKGKFDIIKLLLYCI